MLIANQENNKWTKGKSTKNTSIHFTLLKASQDTKIWLQETLKKKKKITQKAQGYGHWI